MQAAGERVDAEVGAGHRLVVVGQRRVGVGEVGPQRPGVVGVEPTEAEPRELLRHRERADRDRAAVQRGLDQRQPEALPRGRHRDDVARGVGAGHPHAERQPSPVGYAAVGQERVELGLVAVFGRAGEPVGAADGGGEGEPHVDALARDGPRRLQDQRPLGDLETASYRRPAPRAGAFGEAVVDRGGGDAAADGERAAGEVVDRHVPPGGVVGRPAHEVGVAGALPRQVVVAQHRGTAAQVVRHRLADRPVHRQRADVVGDDEVGVTERPVELPPRRRAPGLQRQTADQHVGSAATGDGAHPHAQRRGARGSTAPR